MIRKTNSDKGVNSTYEFPSVKTLDLMSEGVLCGSYDVPDSGYNDDNDLGEI